MAGGLGFNFTCNLHPGGWDVFMYMIYIGFYPLIQEALSMVETDIASKEILYMLPCYVT